MPARRRHRLIMGGSLLAAAALGAWVVLHHEPAKAVPVHAVPVTAARAVSEDMPLTVSALGSAQAWISDMIFAQANGKLISVNFAEGSEVTAGQVLAEVDPAPYQAALAVAQGTLARDQGLLAGAKRDLARYQRLLAQNAIARQIYDDEVATVAQDQGSVQLDQGQVAAARINLAYCRITSPISGRAGVRLVDPGNLVSGSGSMASTPSTAAATSSAAAAGASTATTTSASSGGVASSTGATGTGIVVINQIDPIAVTFTVPQGSLQRLAAASNGFSVPLAVQAYSQETGQLLGAGQLDATDNRVDPATGTVELKARFPNAGRALWPGQFVNVKLVLQMLHNATVIPTTAVNRGPQGSFAFVIGPDGRAVVRPLAVAAVEGGSTIVSSGVRPGELVATDGQMSLRAGSPVRIAQLAPQTRTTP